MKWSSIIVSAYLPTLMSSLGYGAVIPLIPLTAVHIGASAALAAAIAALVGIGQIIGDVPAGWLVTKIGEKWSLVIAMLIDAVALVSMGLVHHLGSLAVAVFVNGMAGAVYGIARQNYLTVAIPYRYRARALSTLGGVFRVGWFVGPMAGSWILREASMSWAYGFASVASVLAAAVTTPDLPPVDVPQTAVDDAPTKISTWTIAKQNSKVLWTTGLGVTALMVVRSARRSLLPLWCHANGLSPATTDLIYAWSMAADVLLFLPGGALMDRFGRWWVAVPSIFIQALALLTLPLAHTATTIGIVALAIGIGNGASSGIVMTLGSDASPNIGRPQFLAAWRLLSDTGSAMGPIVVTLVTLAWPLSAASIVMSIIGLVGSYWMGRWVPHGKR
ncbi:MFS transporter [Cutibacterium acnes]